jgi:hypothetical protein
MADIDSHNGTMTTFLHSDLFLVDDDPVLLFGGDIAGAGVAEAATVDPTPPSLSGNPHHVSGRDFPAVTTACVLKTFLLPPQGYYLVVDILEVEVCHYHV